MSPELTDYDRLYRLISLLPGPDKPDFWEGVAEANKTSRAYVYEKMSLSAFYLGGPVPPSNRPGTHIGHFCTYAIIFFGGEKPKLWSHLAGTIFHTSEDDIGRRLAEDVASTAWRVLIANGYQCDPDRPKKWLYAQDPRAE